MNKYTPGPWKIRPPFAAPNTSLDAYTIYGVHQGNSDDAEDGPIENGEEILLARTYWGSSKANAVLIASAPELLRMLKVCASRLSDVNSPEELRDALDLIAKAEGRGE